MKSGLFLSAHVIAPIRVQFLYDILSLDAFVQLSWFPFFLFDTDWMGREVYHGDPNGNPTERQYYENGVREGAFGLLLNSVRTHEHLVFFIFLSHCPLG